MLPVEQRIIHDWKRGHGDVVELVEEWFVESLAWEGWPEAEVVLRDDVEDVFVEGVLDNHAVSSVIFSAVNE